MQIYQRVNLLWRLLLNIGIVFLAITLLLFIYSFWGKNASLAQNSPNLLADGQFVYGPNVGDFNVKVYLEGINSPLIPYAEIIEERAYYYSINPRVLLTILEIQNNLVTTASSIQMDEGEFYTLLDQLCQNLSAPFYEHLYAQYGIGEIIPKRKLTIKDGTSVNISSGDINAATYALLIALTPSMTTEQEKQMLSPQSERGFVQIYQTLFPQDDPLDESNRLNPMAIPPSDMLKLPVKECSTWKFTGGPHGWNTGYDTPWSSIDFAPAGHSGCSIPTSRWVAAAAGGSVEYHSSYYVRINHGNGWATDYFHLANLQVSNGRIGQDQRLANPSCNGGQATGAHVHFAVVYGGLRQAIDGTTMEGWTVHKGSSAYGGYLQEGDTKIYTPNSLESDTTSPTTAISLIGNPGPNGWYTSNVQVTLKATDNASCTGVKYIKYQIDGGPEQKVNASSVNFIVSGVGNHTITYFSKDYAENVETKKQKTFIIVRKIFLSLILK